MVKRVLIIDDSEVNQEIMKDYLEDIGCEAVTLSSGTEAVKLLKCGVVGNVDCIFLDIQMPDMNGYDTARAIRSIESDIAKVDIIAMSANDSTQDIEKAYDSGMNRYMVKPIDMRQLYALLSKI